MFVAETAAKSGGWSVSAALGAGFSLHHVSADGDRAAMFCAQALAVAQDQRQAPYLAAVVAHARQQLVTAITARATTP